MVGSAQYQDNEIEWVLSAVVKKKKQLYIQTQFREKFGRALNHNQIRYIKNKYGKDPRFNSPLVNIHAPPRVTTPEPEGSSEHEDVNTQNNNDAAFENQNQAGPSMATGEAQNGLGNDGTKATQPKRKRSRHEQGDALERLTTQTNKSQRLNLNFSPQQGAILRTYQAETFSQPQNTLGARLPVSNSHTHPPSMPQASLGNSGHAPRYAGMIQGFQHPHIFPFLHSTNTNVTWAPSMFMTSHSWEVAGNIPVFTSTSGSGDASALLQASPSPRMKQRHSMGYTTFQSPTADQYQLRQPSSQLGDQQVSQFSPATPNLSSPPHAAYQEQHQQLLQQEQQLYSHTDDTIPTLPGSEISNSENAAYVQNLSGVAPQLIPSFQEVPIESTCPRHGTKLSNPSGIGGGINWARTTTPLNSSPQDLSLFNFTTPPMSSPFEIVRQRGLTAATSQAIGQTLHYNANMFNSSLSTQGQHYHSPPQSGQQHLNFDGSTFELLSMAQTPIPNTTTAMPYAQLSYPMNNSTMEFSPSMVQAGNRPHLCQCRSTPGSHVCSVHGTVHDLSGTIDPRLLATNSASPNPRTSGSSPFGETKHEQGTPTKSSSS
ncbi:hypothetical protein TGAM01_v200041 [Trichoderma gamsii]|uniref:Clr5 domain-containing protein n=1 Tax=Trichoderma gamsii TaxID=398673 RepID=A0A2P5A266_9HYPO|nr:hypothetical protein TGAM01_v200041 [Trichoderma gamsii]PON30621.1 hypothetical protein TGAM01_v200041 [Trichoderma gamsii]